VRMPLSTHYTLGGVYRKLSYYYYYYIILYIIRVRYAKVYCAHARAQSDFTIGPLGLSRKRYDDDINNNIHIYTDTQAHIDKIYIYMYTYCGLNKGNVYRVCVCVFCVSLKNQSRIIRCRCSIRPSGHLCE